MSRLSIALASALTIATSAWGQSAQMEEFRNRYRADFEKYRTEKKTEFEAYRARLNAEFAELLAGDWYSYRVHEPVKRPADKPGPLPAVDGSAPARTVSVDAGSVVRVTPPSAPPDGYVAVTVDAPQHGNVMLSFYNTRCSVTSIDSSLTADAAPSAKAVAKVWQRLSDDDRATALAGDCLRLRGSLALCDWGYAMLAQRVARLMSAGNAAGEAVLTVWLLCQGGYDARPGIADGKLCALYSADHIIYETPYTEYNDKRYYPIGYGSGSAKYINAVQGKFAVDAAPLGMTMCVMPRFVAGENPTPYTSKDWNEAPPFSVLPNTSVVEFMQDYPLIDPEVYAASVVSDELKASLYQAIGMIVQGMSPSDAANTILRYVQYSFKYMTDDDQFKQEKPFFVEENFIHAFNDCEDRAILYARLIHDILDYDALLVRYPGHMCAAVAVPGITKGSSIYVDGKRYWLCDPTIKPIAPTFVGYLHPTYSKCDPVVIKVAWQ